MKPRTIPAAHFILFAYLIFTGCSGGGGGGDAGKVPTGTEKQEQAVVSFSLSGDSDAIGSVYLHLELPEGFHLETNNNGGLAEGVLSTDLPDGMIEAVYLPEGNVNYGILRMAFICARGFSSGNFSTLLSDLAAGEDLPLPEEFATTMLTVTNLRGVELSGYEVNISVQRQEAAR